MEFGMLILLAMCGIVVAFIPVLFIIGEVEQMFSAGSPNEDEARGLYLQFALMIQEARKPIRRRNRR